MKEESHNPWIDPELEARIVALVLGEASDFERAELDRLIEQQPELAAFKVQIQSVHGLLKEVGAGESVAGESVADSDWKLSPDKRSTLLAVMSGEVQEQPTKQVVNKFAVQRSSLKKNFFWRFMAVAAVVVFAVGLLSSISVSRWMSASSRLDEVASVMDAIDDSVSFSAEGSAPSSSVFTVDDARIGPGNGKPVPTVVAELAPESDSKSALLAIRASLDGERTLPSPYYLADDVQYFPAGPEFKLPREAAVLRKTRVLEKQNRAATTGVSGQKPVPTRDQLAGLGEGESTWSDGLIRDANQIADSQPSADKADSSELSFPRFAEVADGRKGSGPVSRVHVADGGIVLHGGIKRQTAGRSEGVAGEHTVAPPTFFGDVALGVRGERQEAAKGPAKMWASGDQIEMEEESDDFSGLEERDIGSPDTAQGLDFSRAQSGQPGDTRVGSVDELNESLAAGKEVKGRRFSQDGGRPHGGGFGGGAFGRGFGGGGSAPADRWSKESFGENQPQSNEQAESGGSTPSGAMRMTVPTQPMVAGPGSGTVARNADDAFGTVPLGKSITSPTDRPMVKREQIKEKELLGLVAEDMEGESKEGFAKEGVDTAITGGFAIANGRTLGQNPTYRFQLQTPVTGTASGIPPAALSAESPQQQGGWRYSGRAKNLQHDFFAPTKRYRETPPADDAKDVGKYFERLPSKPQDEREQSQSQLDLLATKGQDHWYGYVPPQLEYDSKAIKKKMPAIKSAASPGLNEKSAEQEAFSTFSLHVSDVSFKLAQAALARGEWPESSKIRIEEFVNAFDYGDPMPGQAENVACRVEQSIHPFLQQRNLLRVSMRTAAAGRSSNTPLRLTLLLDNSGSMERIDRQQTVRRAFSLLAQQLKPIDQVTLISFARQPRLLADKVSGDRSTQLVGLIDDLPSEGGTNIEAALQLAFEKAREHHADDAQNRIILLTDGAVNLGDANPESLSRLITTMRDAGIAFDAAGISAEGLNDEILEALTRKGDGRYYLLDSMEAADDGFARQIAGALRPSAKNVKVQIEFNPDRVGHYKLLGFEKHRLKQEDFRNDKVDAAEMAAAEAGVAVYQFEAKPDGEGDVGSVSVRFRDLSSGQMIENRWPIPYEADAPRCDQAAPSLRVAASAALLAAKLRGEPLGEIVDLKTLSNLISGLPVQDRNAKRVQQLQLMIGQARQVSGK